MKILFVTSEPPSPAVNGVRIPAYHAIQLMSRDNDVMLASLISPECESYDLKPLEDVCQKVVTVELPRRHPASVAFNALLRGEIYYMERFRSETFRKKLKEMINEFKPDVIHFDYILTTQYVDCVPSGVGSVASVNDSFTLNMKGAFEQNQHKTLLMKMYRRVQYYQVRHFEKTCYAKFDITHTMTEVDGAYLKSLNSNINAIAIPNGTSVEDLTPSDDLPTDHVIFVGKLTPVNVEPLVEFLNIAWTKIRSVNPNAVLHIVGRETPTIKAIYEIADRVGGVQFEGFVENLADVYAKAGISMVPINRNSGIINKAIEAMTAGLCMVGFHKTFEGVPEAINGKNCLTVERFEEMADVILDVMNDKQKQRDIQREARQTAIEHFSWQSRRAKYQQMYEKAAMLARESL